MVYKKLFFISLPFTLLSLGLLVYHLFFHQLEFPSPSRQLRQNDLNPNTAYQYINPLLACGGGKKEIEEFTPLKEELEAYLKDQVAKGTISSVSVYFDTRDGRWLSLSPDEQYSPGSLMKVLTMIAVLKTAESDPAFLQKKIIFKGAMDDNAVQFFKPKLTLVAGQSYTIEELLDRSIAYSDNNAVAMLLQSVDRKFLLDVYSDLGISIPASSKTSCQIISPSKHIAISSGFSIMPRI